MSEIEATLYTVMDKACELVERNTPCIEVIHVGGTAKDEIYADSGGSILFFNNLYPKTMATIEFYKFGDKRDPNDASSVGTKDFLVCTGNNAAVSSVTIKHGKGKYCNMANAENFDRRIEYLVEASGHQTLDPVIIIRPMATTSFIMPTAIGLLSIAAAVFIGGIAALGAFRWLKK